MAAFLVSAARERGPIELGVEAFQRKDYLEAQKQFKRAVLQNPRNAHANKLLGVVYAVQEDYRSAQEPLRLACALDSHEEDACFYLGRVYYSLGRFEESLKTFKAALAVKPDGSAIQRGVGLALEALGRPAEAELHFLAAARDGSNYTLLDYGMFLFRQGRLGESAEVLRRAGATKELAKVMSVLAAQPGAAPAKPPAPVRFAATDLPMIVRNAAAGHKHQIEMMVSGVAVLDYDNDGWPDIYVANGAAIPSLEKTDASFANHLFHNNQDGTFTDVTASAGIAGRGYCMGVAAADYDNDGWQDIFVTGVRGNILYRNRGDGSFEDVTEKAGLKGSGHWSIAAGWFDYDNDGYLDLVVVNYVVWNPGTEPYCGDARPEYRGYCAPQEYQPTPNELYHNQHDGTFRDVSRESGLGAHLGKGMGVAFGDYDLDGFLDVFVGNDTVPNFLFHNLKDGKFEEVALAAGVAYSADGRAVSSMGADFRDLDNDGREDIFVSTLSGDGFTFFRNLGGKFVDISYPSRTSTLTKPFSGWGMGAFDLNNDGFKDVFTADGFPGDNAELTMTVESRQSNIVLLNQGDSFQLQKLPGKALYRGAAFGDFNRDGLIDVVVTRLNEAPQVLPNVTDTRNHWLAVKLRGRRSNRDGIGARVRIVTDSGSQWNRITTSVGFAGSSEPVAHFGLGRDRIVKLIEIQWPSGTAQRLEKIEADRYLEIEEPLWSP